MNCPSCGAPDSITIKEHRGETVERHRLCPICRNIWQTVEITIEEHNSAKVASISNEFMKRILHTLGENGDES